VQPPPEPAKAYLEHGHFSLSSPDGQTQFDVRFEHANKNGDSYDLDQGTLRFANGGETQLSLSITDANYNVTNGVVYVVGSMEGKLASTGHHFSARRLSWNEASNAVTAEAVHYSGDRIDVQGQTMRVQLPAGVVEFSGPITATVAGGKT